MGATGFLGYKIVQMLLEKGFSVVMGVPAERAEEDEQLIKKVLQDYGEAKVRVSEFSFFQADSSYEFLEGAQALIHCARAKQK